MATKSEVQQGTPIDKVLHETEIGAWIARHKMLFIALVVAIVLGILGWGIGRHFLQQSHEENRTTIFNFKEQALADFQAKKLKPEEVVAKFKELQQKTQTHRSLAPVALSLSDELVAQDQIDLGLEVLEEVYPTLSKENAYLNHLLTFRMAAIYEDKGNPERAIELLEKLNTSSLKLMEWKVYLDLGRLYLQKGDTEKAKGNLQYIVDNSTDQEIVKLAKLYLGKI